jgi:hypothetical protein
MDNPNLTDEQILLDDVLARLRAMGVQGEIVEREPNMGHGHIRPDALVRLKRGAEDVLVAVEVKRGLRPGTLGATLLQLGRLGETAMLMADYVTPPLAEQLRAHKIAFADAAGNAYIERPNWLIWVKGEKPTEGAYAPEQKGRAFQASGLRVLFALLCKPKLINENYRAIAAEAGVAHGTVGWVMAELPTLGFVAEIAGKRRLLQPERLLQQWVEAYARKLRPKLLVGRYQADGNTWQTTLDPLKYAAVWGGETAAAKMTNMLRPEITTLYVRKRDPALIHAARLKPDPTGNVELVTRFWEFENDPLELAPAILVYADLLATGDARCIEVARELHGGIVARFNQ